MTIKLPDGRNLGYAQFGSASGTPLLYFHGGLSSRLDIAFAGSECAKRNIRLLAPDRPGIGLSDRKPNRTLLDWADDVAYFLSALNIDRLPLLAWSMAGPSAFACAYKSPQTFTRICTVGSAPPLDYPNAIKEMGLLLDRIALTSPAFLDGPLALFMSVTGKLPLPLLKWQMEGDVISAPDRQIIAAMSTAEATGFVLESVRQGGAGNIDDYNTIKHLWGFQLSEIKVPIQLWYGTEDRLCPTGAHDYVARQIPDAKVVAVPGEGHFLLHHKLADVLDALME